MNASLLLQSHPSQTNKMMLAYPACTQQPTFLHRAAPTLITASHTHGLLSGGGQLASLPMAITPTLFQPSPHLLAEFTKTQHDTIKRRSVSTSPPAKPSHSIESILAKRDEPTAATAEQKQEHIQQHSISHHHQHVTPQQQQQQQLTRTTANGLFYIYTAPTQPSAFPFATALRPYEHELQRSPLGPMILQPSGKRYHAQ